MKKKKDDRRSTADTEARIGLEIKRIWADDLFQRRGEAEMLHAYIVSAARRATNVEDQRAFTIAIDAGYGEGKTFFLRRLAAHLATRHPVAFVDAWADDIIDEPLTALAATLKRALEPLLAKSPTVRERWKEVLEKTSVIAGLAARGIVKRGFGLLITSAAVEAAAEVLQGLGEEVQSAVQEDLQTSGSDMVSSSVDFVAAPQRLMQKRIDAFEEGRAAVADLKASLAALVAALGEKDQSPPIVIVVDELDRCRPPYAIKLLEEIKHLFDVPGLVFVFGMHGSQLAHSVAGRLRPEFRRPRISAPVHPA
ncbi:MAG TPA: P-loop NTPase fold protein [Allosphingosinicella sp.]